MVVAAKAGALAGTLENLRAIFLPRCISHQRAGKYQYCYVLLHGSGRSSLHQQGCTGAVRKMQHVCELFDFEAEEMEQLLQQLYEHEASHHQKLLLHEVALAWLQLCGRCSVVLPALLLYE